MRSHRRFELAQPVAESQPPEETSLTRETTIFQPIFAAPKVQGGKIDMDR